MNTLLLIIKGLLFLEGFLFGSLSFDTVISNANPSNTLLAAAYTIGYLGSFGWVWWADRSRKIQTVLPVLTVSALLSKLLHQSSNETEWVFFFSLFASVLSAVMIVPLTCAFTMMQFSPKQERERWTLQYIYFILGKLFRVTLFNSALDNLIPATSGQSRRFYFIAVFEFVLAGVMILLARLIPAARERESLKRDLQAKSAFSVKTQIYTPITKLMGQARYCFFLLSVVMASFTYLSFKAVYSSALTVDLRDLHPALHLCLELLAALISYALVPRIIAPQGYFLLSQFIASLGFLVILVLGVKVEALPSALLLQIISAVTMIFTTTANAQIIATFAKPGLEYTTCALVDICKNGIAPVLLTILSKCTDVNFNLLMMISTTFLLLFSLKYYFIDYPHDKVLIKNKY